jgi:hypothetical protein
MKFTRPLVVVASGILASEMVGVRLVVVVPGVTIVADPDSRALSVLHTLVTAVSYCSSAEAA